MIEKFLNQKDSLRKLTDEEFDSISSVLASELEGVSFIPTFSQTELYTDWRQLIEWNEKVTEIASTQRVGIKLCEHFFPNFWDIKSPKGESFRSLWKEENLTKVLKWNRHSHITPYLSELKRGIYFCCGLTKSTMYRPQMAKMVVSKLGGKRVLDPCAGWGGRLLGSVSAGAEYVAFEPNTETYKNLLRLTDFLGINDKVTIINDSALEMNKYSIGEFDVILTSPPYFDLEVYTDEPTQSITGCKNYMEWLDKFLKPLVQLSLNHLSIDGWSCWNVHNIGKMKMIDDVKTIHNEYGNEMVFSVSSSKRQSNKTADNNKNKDITVCYSKTPIRRHNFF